MSVLCTELSPGRSGEHKSRVLSAADEGDRTENGSVIAQVTSKDSVKDDGLQKSKREPDFPEKKVIFLSPCS